jgi:hypothetical protein
MGWGGIIAGAMGAGAGAVGDIAQGHIDHERKTKLAQELAAIEEAKQMRLENARRMGARADKIWATSGEGAAAQLEFEDKSGRAASQRAVDQKRAEIPVEAERAQALTPIEVERQKLLKKAEIAVEDAANNDPTHLAGIRKKTAASETSATRAAAAESAARVRIAGVELELKKIGLDDARDLNKLFDRAQQLQADPNVDPKVREAELAKIQQQVALIRSKNGGGGVGPKESDKAEMTEETTSPDGSKKTTKKWTEVRRAGAGDKPGQDFPPPPETAVAALQRNAKGGNRDAEIASFERTFGPGSAAKHLGGGAPPAPAQSQVSGRPYAHLSSQQLNQMMADRGVSWMQKSDIRRELDERKSGDIAPL